MEHNKNLEYLQNYKVMKNQYISPSVEIEEVEIEKGFATSGVNDYGADGEAGQLEEGDSFTW